MRKQIIQSVLLFSSMFFFLTSAAVQAEVVDRVVAIVNDDVITLSEMNKEGEAFFKQISEQVPAAERLSALEEGRRKVLSLLIDNMITAQKADELRISVSKADIDMAVEQVISRNRTTRDDLLKELAAMGSSEEELRKNLSMQILQSKLVNYEVTAKIVITEEKIKAHYAEHYAEKIAGGGYYILQMGFSWGEQSSRSKDEARQQAEFIREMAVSGQDFSELAKKYSDLPSATDGGDIGVFNEDEMAPYMRETILPMSSGEISPVVETESAYQFFKLITITGVETAAQAQFEKVKEEIRELIYQQEINTYYEKWVKSLREEAYIKELL